MSIPQPLSDNFSFLHGGGEMGQLIRNHPWETTSLGRPVNWPQSLKTILGLLVNSKFPMFLWWGPDHICFYNDAYRPSLGNNGKHPSILGAPAIDAWPEIWDYIKPIIDQILTGGESTFNEDLLLPIFRNGQMEDVYWTFSYSPVIDESNRPAGVFVTCTETTGKVELVNSLVFSEQRFQTLVREATVGIIALIGDDWKVDIVNAAYGKLIDRTVEELLNQPLFTLIPETEADYKPILEQVKETGEPLYLYENAYSYINKGNMLTGYLNLVYQPYNDVSRKVNGVMVLCQDVTEQVKSRIVVENALEQMRLSKEAAKLGTFDLDLESGTMEWDKRCRILFGISHDDNVTYEKDFVTGLHPEDRERIVNIINDLFASPATNGDYDVEYRTIGVEDKQLRWVRAKGKVYYGGSANPVRFIGSVLDITKEKLEELRRDDFVGIASHELKTPLTSLTGVLQMTELKLKNNEDNFLAGAMGKALVQVKKMSNLINGFLNLSRLESGKIHLDVRKFYLTQLITDAIEQIRFTTPIDIEMLPCDDLEVYADQERI